MAVKERRMASMTQRTFILAFSQLFNFAVQFMSPIFLVRLLDKTTFGQYREFLVYSAISLSFIGFGVKGNLMYFISVDPANEKKFVTNTTFLLLAFSLIGITVIYFLRNQIGNLTTYNFIFLLMLYIFCYQNIDLLDTLLLARKRSDHVLYWTSANIIIRTGTLIWVAYRTNDVLRIIYLLILLEVAKTIFTVAYLLKNRLLGMRIDRHLLKQQLYYILPLGFAAVIGQVNTNLSNVIISAKLGAAVLAIYAIGSQKIPLLNIITQSVTYVIFPEMAGRIKKDPMLALGLWNQSNVLYAFLLLPSFFILFVYADVLINTLFTTHYSEAIPLFRIYLLLMIRRCFELGTPLRAMNKNMYFVFANFLALIVNIILVYALFTLIGFYGPAVAFVTAEFALGVFLSIKTISSYQISWRELLPWKKIGWIVLINFLALPVLLLRNVFDIHPIVAAVLFSIVFMGIYLMALRWLQIDEVDLFMSKILHKLHIRWKRRAAAST
jgi:O-antigen/teichoic acid export membrane protein